MIQKYITELLHEYNCVVLPNLGGFITRYISADIHPITNKITPPSKEIAFNEMLNTDDGVLVNYITNQQGVSFEQAVQLVADFVRQTQDDLRRFNVILIEGIGKLFYNEADKLEFLPELESNFLEDSFGLGELFLKPVEPYFATMENIPPKSSRPPLRRRPTVKVAEPTIKQLKKAKSTPPESEHHERSLKPAMLWSLVVLFLIGGSSFLYFNKDNKSLASILPSFSKSASVKKSVEKEIVETSTSAIVEPVIVQPSMAIESSKKYFVVVGSFQRENNAQKLVDQFAAKNQTLTLLTPADGEQTYRVVAAEFSSKTQARAKLDNYRSQFGNGTWVLSR